jgi:hypothetical protein
MARLERSSAQKDILVVLLVLSTNTKLVFLKDFSLGSSKIEIATSAINWK